MLANNRSGDVILLSVERRSGIIKGIWPLGATLHGVAGKRCLGRKIQSFLSHAATMALKKAVSKKNKEADTPLPLEFHSKKSAPATYNCSVWHMRKQAFVLVIHQPVNQEAAAAVTEFIAREEAEKLVREAEDKFKRIIEKITMPIAAYEIHLPKRFAFMNPKFTEWFGYTIEDLPDMDRWRELAFRDETYFLQMQKQWQTELYKVHSGEKPESGPIDVTVYCKDGTIKDLELSLTTDENLCYITFNDVTERNAILRTLRENERHFRNISEQLPIPICVFSDKGETRFLNQAFIDTFGYGKEDIPTRKDWLLKAYPDINYRQEIKATRESVKQTHQKSGTLVKHYEVTCKDGSKKKVEFFVSAGQKNIYIVANDVTGKVIAEQELKQSHRQLRELSSYLENIREEERKHISREIHDELGQQLTLLKLDLLQMTKKINREETELIEKMKQADQLLADTMRSVRKIATQLRPSILDNLGLVSALEWQSREFEKNFGIHCVFESLLNEPYFSISQSNALFRIYQEALTNIARHAGATQVDAVLSQDNDRYVLEIRDNGKGFTMDDVVDSKKTLGLKGMQERALMIDGEFQIQSSPGQGTYIQISIPILITNQEINQL